MHIKKILQSLFISLLFCCSYTYSGIKPDSTGIVYYEGGYASTMSLYQGDSITFYISTAPENFSLNIYRYGKEKELITSIGNLKGGLQQVPDSSWCYGCRWKPSCTIKIPDHWKSGMYLAEFPTSSDTVLPVLFVVKEKDPANRNKIIVDINFSNYNAYNNFGGKSSYEAYSIGGYSVILSYLRPLTRIKYANVDRGSFFGFESKVIRWLETNGYLYDVLADHDLERDSAYLNSADVIIVSGHSEYWSWRMRQNVEEFVDRGGHLMVLGGNTCWWQTRYENNYNTLVCYKNLFDPIFAINPLLRTTNWWRIKRENKFIGGSYQNGGNINYDKWLPPEYGYGGFVVHNSQHWIYNNSGLNDGDILGFHADSSITGYEVDAVLYKFANGIPVPMCYEDETPQNFRILGICPASDTRPPSWLPTPGLTGIMGIYKRGANGGFVFNAGTIRWPWGLQYNKSDVSIVTKNILNKMLKNSFPPEIICWSPAHPIDTMSLNMPMSFNRREMMVKYGKPTVFKAYAYDYKNKPLSYYWTVNDSLVSKDKVLKLNTLDYTFSRDLLVRVYIYNDKDTSKLAWNINTAAENGIAISSDPDTLAPVGEPYRYSLNTHSHFGRKITYIINHLPKWAKFDPLSNVIYGQPSIENLGIDSICVTAADEDDDRNFDKQEAQIYVVQSVNSVSNDKYPSDYTLFQNYPNPFNGETHIKFFVKYLTDVQLRIYDVMGRVIRQYDFEGMQRNTLQEIEWNGTDNLGRNVSSGIYFCSILFKQEGKSFSKKMIYLK